MNFQQQQQLQQQRLFGSLVSAKDLKTALGSVKILDGSWHMPNTNRDPYQEFLQKRIAGSQFFGIDTIKDTSTDLPHMLPSPEKFSTAVGKMGIDENDHVVVYDTAGVFSACRVYWTFKVFGHQSISVLNGGLPAWEDIAGPIETNTTPAPVEPKTYKVPTIDRSLVRDYQAVLENARNIQNGAQNGAQVLDARPYARFTGEAPEPREGLSSGHMPGSISVPFNEVIQDGKLLDENKLREVFEAKGVDISKDIITSCGSGITASILYLALERIGARHLAVYDGSWTEYAGMQDSIIVKKQ
ncbi:Rhodanese-like domain-containing protein [Mycotypha africana]|uniref:Rhodanese-like domain-containing protein n=1 Tax=Mycotypha africana TaxID=64632 RepID=UPI0023007312|nr:Rhodanese-like domain-containing protein [Mycotypha africana]KAI8992065.1 Rhodanese-like domain-containing protein [Mycotypha africana]